MALDPSMMEEAPQAAPVAAPPAQEAPQAPVAGLADPQAAQKFFSDPKAMYAVAQLAAKNRQGDTIKWLAMGHAAVRENAIEATQHLLAGDGEAAVKAFNKSGRYNDAKSATKNDDGTWTLERGNGAKMTVDPNQVMRSFLSPKDFSAQQEADARTKILQQNADTQQQTANSTAAYHEGVLKHYERSDESQANLREAQAEKARTAFAHQLELLGVRNAARDALAAARGNVVSDKAALADAGAPAKLRADLLKNGPLASQFADDPAKLTAAVDFTVRDAFTPILPRRDGKGFDVVTTVSGEPVILGNFPDIEAANAAKQAFVTGKNPAAPKPNSSSAKPNSATPRTLSASPTPESWAQQQNDATLQATAARGGAFAAAAQAEIERRKTQPQVAEAAPPPVPPRTILPNVPRPR